MTDRCGREIEYLRLSVTDLCNYRCIYCMSPQGVPKRDHGDICSLEELEELAGAAVGLGVKKIRLTGGEPLVRRGIVELTAKLRTLPGLEELTMTTNGALLPQLAAPLRRAGLDRLNLSLDTLRPERFAAITRTGSLDQFHAGLEAAAKAGFRNTRINVVLLGGINDDEIPALAALARDLPVSVRFIELMPIGVSAALPAETFVPAGRVLECLPQLEPAGQTGVARLYTAPGWAGTVGLISPMSNHFCSSCNRIRITCQGTLKPCLHSREEFPLRGLHGETLRRAMARAIAAKPQAHHLCRDHHSQTDRAMHEIGG